MEKKVLIHTRVKNIITHISQGLKERDEAISLALLSSLAGETMLLFGSHGTGKNLVKQHLNYAFKNAQKLTRKKLIFTHTCGENKSEAADFPRDILLKYEVSPIQDEKTFLKLIDDKKSKTDIGKAENPFDEDELALWSEQIQEIKLSPEVQEAILSIRRNLSAKNQSQNDENSYISDNRWSRIAWLLKTSAFLNGRKSVDLIDCQLIAHCIWQVGGERFDLVRETLIHAAQTSKETTFSETISKIEKLVQEYISFIEEKFFIDSPSSGEKVKSPELFGYIRPEKPFPIEMSDGTAAFRILRPKEIRSYDYITPHYVSANFKTYPEGCGAYFDEFRERIEKNDRYRDKYFTQNLRIENSDGITKAVWTDGDCKKEYSFEIKVIPEEFIKGDEQKLSDLRAQADEKSRFLIETIKNESEKIQKYIRSKERQYNANLFADSSICDALLEKAKAAKNQIDESLEKLSAEMAKMQEGIK